MVSLVAHGTPAEFVEEGGIHNFAFLHQQQTGSAHAATNQTVGQYGHLEPLP